MQRNAEAAGRAIRVAAANGAQVILVQEFFEAPYFCIERRAEDFRLARPFDGHPLVALFQSLVTELGVVLPGPFFKNAGQVHFYSAAMTDAEGRILGRYRKSHIPQGPGYEEKFHFSPGDTGIRVWDTAFGRVGLGACWGQWFPKVARAMAPQGTKMLL